jgi:dTDP-4-dehydrorhamnose 3,5-epimerase
MTRFTIIATPIAGLTLLQRYPRSDERGYLDRLFCHEDLASIINGRAIIQINRTYTAKAGTLRGMHFQFPPYAEMKLVSCLRGEVYDVALDLRRGSPTFLNWHAEYLSAANSRTLCIPEGFAHGFQTLAADCELLYLHTAAYQPQGEAGVNALDPRLDIRWPLPVMDRSVRDQAHPFLDPEFSGIDFVEPSLVSTG